MQTSTIITIICAIFASQGFWSWLTARFDRKSCMTRLVLGISYDILRTRGEAYIARGYVTTEEFKEYEKFFYNPYKKLGGNGTVEKLFDDVKRLPIREG